MISLPYIEDFVKERRELSDLEILSYIYQKEVDDDKIEIANSKQKKVLEIMNEKMRKMLSEDIILDETVKNALYVLNSIHSWNMPKMKEVLKEIFKH